MTHLTQTKGVKKRVGKMAFSQEFVQLSVKSTAADSQNSRSLHAVTTGQPQGGMQALAGIADGIQGHPPQFQEPRALKRTVSLTPQLHIDGTLGGILQIDLLANGDEFSHITGPPRGEVSLSFSCRRRTSHTGRYNLPAQMI